MLVQLRIQDLAIIEEIELVPGPGLNVITGETGAGKSIIVGAAALLRGGRASSDLVRTGRAEASVEALFDLAAAGAAGAAVRERLEAAGLGGHGDELSARRVIGAGGKGRAYLNGNSCTLATLAEVVALLFEISGQHEHQRLSRERGAHRELLDAAFVEPATREAVTSAFSNLREVAAALARSRMDDRERAARIDFLRFQLEELEAAGLRPGEENDLEAERQRLLRAGELRAAADDGEQILYGGEGAVAERLARVERQLSALVAVEPRLTPLRQQLEEARVSVEDVAQSLRRLGAASEPDPGRLEAIDERLDRYRRLRRKHGATIEELLAREQEMRGELDELTSLEARRDDLERELASAREHAAAAARSLTGSRERAARTLAERVSAELEELRMHGARIEVALAARPVRESDDPAFAFDGRRLGADGWDRVELLIAANPGEEPRSLSLAASGGELSRIMLALRRVLGEHDPVSTSIFDEVDAGIGGAVADAVGRALAEVARRRQVLCVTHLPQVAAHAAHHFFVDKRVAGGRTRTELTPLEGEARVAELARLLGGERVTEQARENARALLSAARSPARRPRRGPVRRRSVN
jgi:DNA repair protein RecN (Recombination protein N)